MDIFYTDLGIGPSLLRENAEYRSIVITSTRCTCIITEDKWMKKYVFKCIYMFVEW